MPDEQPQGGAGVETTPQTPQEEPFDRDRAMRTIENLRGFEKTAKAQEKQIADLTTRLKAIDDASLSELEKAKKTAQEADERAKSIETALRGERLTLSIEREARRLNIVDPEAAALLVQSKVEYDKDGKPVNVGDLLTQLAKDKPYLVGQAGATSLPGAGASATNPSRGGGAQTQSYTREQIRDPQFYEANRPAIMKAMAEGRITD